jgi:MFS family permease
MSAPPTRQAATNAPRTPGFPQGILLLLTATMAVMGISVLTPVVHLLLAQFQSVPYHDYLVMGGVLTMPAMCMLLFAPVAGWLADRFGRRKLLVTAMVVYAFVGAAPAFLDNLYWIIASRIGVGLCESIVMTVSTTLISDYFSGTSRERWLASQTAVASVSALGIIYLGGRLGAAYGWRGPFFLYFYSIVLAAGVYFFTWEPRPVPASGIPTALKPSTAPPFPWRRLSGIYALTLLASISFYTIITKNAEALVSLGVTDPAVIGKYTMLASIGVPLGTFLYWGLARLPIPSLLLVDFVFIGVGFVLMGRATDAPLYVWGAFVNQIGCGLVLPTMLVWATRGLDFHVRGRGNGLWQATFAIGQFLSGMVVTLLSKQLGGLLPTFNLMGDGALCLGIAAWIVGSFWLRPAAPRVKVASDEPMSGG